MERTSRNSARSHSRAENQNSERYQSPQNQSNCRPLQRREWKILGLTICLGCNENYFIKSKQWLPKTSRRFTVHQTCLCFGLRRGKWITCRKIQKFSNDPSLVYFWNWVFVFDDEYFIKILQASLAIQLSLLTQPLMGQSQKHAPKFRN